MRKSVSIIFFLALLLVPQRVAAEVDIEPPADDGLASILQIDPMWIGESYTMGTYLRDNVGVTEVNVYVNGKRIKEGEPGISTSLGELKDGARLWRFNWVHNYTHNGLHELQFEVKDAAGNTSWLRRTSGATRITFKILNEVPPPTPAPKPEFIATLEPGPRCQAAQAEVDKLTVALISAMTKRTDYMNQVLVKLDAYRAKVKKTAKREQTATLASIAAKNAESALASLSIRAVNCDENPSPDYNVFSGMRESNKAALNVYRASLKQYIEALHD